MSINIKQTELIIDQKLNNTLSTNDINLYTKTVEKLNNGLVITVGNFSDLPNIDQANYNFFYFVEGERTVYVPNKSLSTWKKLVDDLTTLIYSWGTNNKGRLGDGTYIDRSSPVSVVGGFSNWISISAGSRHAAAIRNDNTLWTWGYGAAGRLGDNTVCNKSSPVSVVGGFTDWCSISSAWSHNAALRTNGTIWTWGCNNRGQLGINSIIDFSSPVSVVGGFTDWCFVTSSSYNNAAIRTNGTLWTWGSNSVGQLGDSTATDRSSPVSVVGGFTDWCKVSIGGSHTAAIRTNGTIWTWGSGSQGRLGDSYEVNRSSPVSVAGGFTDWCAVSVGDVHTTAIRTNGTLWSWGSGVFGRLGDGFAVDRSSPVSVVGGFTDWCEVSAGNTHNAALRTNGTLWTWGSNSSGKLGNNTTISVSSPVSVVGGFTDWCAVSTGQDFSIALRYKNS